MTRRAASSTPIHADLTQHAWAASTTTSTTPILLDAPCTGLGNLGRHPELRWTSRYEDIAACAGLQRALLERCLTRLRPDWPPRLRRVQPRAGGGPAAGPRRRRGAWPRPRRRAVLDARGARDRRLLPRPPAPASSDLTRWGSPGRAHRLRTAPICSLCASVAPTATPGRYAASTASACCSSASPPRNSCSVFPVDVCRRNRPDGPQRDPEQRHAVVKRVDPHDVVGPLERPPRRGIHAADYRADRAAPPRACQPPPRSPPRRC